MTIKIFLSVSAVFLFAAVFVLACKICEWWMPGHLWKSAMGGETSFGKWRLCHRCGHWVRPWSRCEGWKTSCCGKGRS